MLAVVGCWIWLQVRREVSELDFRSIDRKRLNRLFTRAQAEEFVTEEETAGEDLAQEIKLSLLEEESTEVPSSPQSNLSLPVKLALCCGIPLLALGLYWFAWGDPIAIDVDRVPPDFLNTQSAEIQEDTYQLFKRRAEAQVDDGSAWFYLMQLQWMTNRLDELVTTHPVAAQHGHMDLSMDQWYLLAIANLRRPLDDPHTQVVLDRVIEADVSLPLLIEMMVYRRSIDQGDLASAYAAGESILSKPVASDIRRIMEDSMVATLNPYLQSLGATLVVVVEIPAGLVTEGWLSVIARPVEGGIPVAVQRRPLGHENTQREFKVLLSDLAAMQPSMKLSNFTTVEVEAKISSSSAIGSDDALFRTDPQLVDPHKQSQIHLVFEPASE